MVDQAQDSSQAIKVRYKEIDDLRGIAIIAMIMVHTNYYFLSDKVSFSLWDLGQFSVPAFVFCSAYLYFRQSHKNEGKHPVTYLLKRLKRLIIPYYIYAIAHTLLILVKSPSDLTSKYFFQTIFLIGGIDINWLVLLFLEIAIVLPLVYFAKERSTKLTVTLGIFAIFSSVGLLFYQLPFNFKYIMWLPWSVVLFYALFYIRYNTHKYFTIFSAVGLFCLFYLLRIYETIIHHSLSMYDNKYPPNIYYLAFSLFVMTLLLYLFRKVSYIPWVTPILKYFSKYSYEIFFIHFFILSILTDYLNIFHFMWYTFFGAIIVLTVISQTGIQFLYGKISIKNR